METEVVLDRANLIEPRPSGSKREALEDLEVLSDDRIPAIALVSGYFVAQYPKILKVTKVLVRRRVALDSALCAEWAVAVAKPLGHRRYGRLRSLPLDTRNLRDGFVSLH